MNVSIAVSLLSHSIMILVAIIYIYVLTFVFLVNSNVPQSVFQLLVCAPSLNFHKHHFDHNHIDKVQSDMSMS